MALVKTSYFIAYFLVKFHKSKSVLLKTKGEILWN